MANDMINEGSPANDDGATYDRGWEAGYKAGLDESRAAIDGAYNDGFEAGHSAGYLDGQAEADNMTNRKAPPDFAEPFGAEE